MRGGTPNDKFFFIFLQAMGVCIGENGMGGPNWILELDIGYWILEISHDFIVDQPRLAVVYRQKDGVAAA